MSITQQHIGEHTPLGATVRGDGISFRIWAPAARAVHVVSGDRVRGPAPAYEPRASDALQKRADGTWAGFLPGARDGTPYLFWVEGEGSRGWKRDPYARELASSPPFPDCPCLAREAHSYPWPGGVFAMPEFRDLVIYQLHFGVYHAVDGAGRDARLARRGRFLDLIERIEYLHELGVNAIQPLPIQEFPSEFSLGYNGTDYFSPEQDYQVEDEAQLKEYLGKANALLLAHGRAPLELEQIRSGPNQLKLVIDLCHLHGIAVILDVVYNHAGGGFDERSLYFLDRRPRHDHNQSLYFTDRGWAGGLVFAYWNDWVRQFLIDNALALLEEYRVDGFRYDEVSVMDEHGGWRFCQDLAATVRFAKPAAIQIAEYWKERRELAVTPAPAGMGFDAALADRLRDALRRALAQARAGAHAAVELAPLREALHAPHGFPAAWRAVQCVENHDVVRRGREPRLAALADGSDPSSWYARSRARAATAVLLTAPGIPLLFMGQEVLEDRSWDDNPLASPDSLIRWEALAHERARRDHHALVRDLLRLRRQLPALRGERIHAYHAHDPTRVLAFHRWLEGEGRDVVVVASLAESTHWDYELGFPLPGAWFEVFNSDHYDHRPNPWVAGNAGRIRADGPPRHGLPHSARAVIPANAVLVFARDAAPAAA